MELLNEIIALINEKEFNQVINKVNTFLAENPKYKNNRLFSFCKSPGRNII